MNKKSFIKQIEASTQFVEPEDMAVSIAIFQAVLAAKMLERVLPESRVELMRRSGIDRKTIAKYLSRYQKLKGS